VVVEVPKPCLSAAVQAAAAPGAPGAKAASALGLLADTAEPRLAGGERVVNTATTQIKPSRRPDMAHLANRVDRRHLARRALSGVVAHAGP
jgi:hypothetical protein